MEKEESRYQFQLSSVTLGTRVKPKGHQPKAGPKQPVISVKPLGSLGGYQKHTRKHLNKWNGVARVPLVKKALYDTSSVIGFLRVEAQQLAQFHILRCFEADIAVDIGSNFWYWIYKSVRDMRFMEPKQTEKMPPEIYKSATQYAERVPVPTSLPKDITGEFVQWSDNNSPDWRTDCLKAAAKHMETNMNEMHSFSGYRAKLSSVVDQFLMQLYDFSRKIRLSMRNAILKSLQTSQQLSVVRADFPNVADVEEGVIETIQTTIVDAIRPIVSSDLTNPSINLRSVFDLRCLLQRTFSHNLPTRVQIIPEEVPNSDFTTLPMWSAPCEKLANEIGSLHENSTTKEVMVLVRRAIDLMRMANHSLLETDDVGWPSNGNVSRRPVVLKLISDAVFGDGSVDFTSQANSRLLTAEEQTWCSTVAADWKYPADPTDIECYLCRLKAHIRTLSVRQKVNILRKKKINKAKSIKLPTLCPIANKRAVFVDLPNDAITKLAESIAKKDTSIHNKLVVLRETQKKTKKAYESYKPSKQSGGKEKKRKDVEPPTLLPEQVEALKTSSERAKQEYDEACWLALFKIKGIGRLGFDSRMITDGVSVFVQCWRPKTDEELHIEDLGKRIREERKKEKGKPLCKSGTCKKDGCCTKESEPQDVAAEAEMTILQEAQLLAGIERARQLLNEPGHRQPRFFDPGASGHEGVVYDEEAFHTRHLPRGQIKHFERISLRKTEMVSVSGNKRRSKKMADWMAANDAVTTFNQHAPSELKLSAEQFIQEYCIPTNQALGDVYDFHAQNCMRRLRFNVASRTRMMLERAIDMICGTSNQEEQKKTVVVFGDAAVNSGKCGHSRICYGALIGMLKSRCCFVTVGEFRSSKLCCCCHQELGKVVVAEGRSTTSWKVRVCLNRLCHRTYFQRDLNAAINLCKFFFWKLLNIEFPPEFRRGNRDVQDDDDDEEEEDTEEENNININVGI